MVVGAAVASRLVAAAPVRRIGALLQDNAPSRASLAVFQQRLRELGWVDGENLQFEIRWAGDDSPKARSLAAELVGARPDVIFAQGTGSMVALLRHATTVPVVFVQITDPMKAGFVKDLERPGGQVTGFANFGSDVAGIRVRLLREFAPKLQRLFVVRDEAYPSPPGLWQETETVADELKLPLLNAGIREASELAPAIAKFSAEPNGGLVVFSDPFTNAESVRITELAIQHRLPSVYSLASFAENGGLLSYGIDLRAMWRSAADYVDRILHGTKAGELPVRTPEVPEIAVNLKTARAIGLSVPDNVRSRATRVIE